MGDLQKINKYDIILDIIFDPNSYEMDEKEMLNRIWKTRFFILLQKEAEAHLLQKIGGHARINIKVEPELYLICLYPGSIQSITMVLKYEYQGLPRGVCNNLDILRKGIQTFSGVCEAMCIMADVIFLNQNTKFKNDWSR